MCSKTFVLLLDAISLHRSILNLEDIAAIKLTFIKKKVRTKILRITNVKHKIRIFPLKMNNEKNQTTFLISVELEMVERL